MSTASEVQDWLERAIMELRLRVDFTPDDLSKALAGIVGNSFRNDADMKLWMLRVETCRRTTQHSLDVAG